ncbi:MAG TPA: PadR family transcriptional regulator [Burkholderiaceae bacterium]|nr:PadR family transcriptional regulator [Burkholderiaceae bacterium]
MRGFARFFHDPRHRTHHHHHGFSLGDGYEHRGHRFGRRGHHDPFGHHHGDRSERGHGRDEFERGRKIGSDELQVLILALLAERARHGYELIKEIEQRSGGWYVPSPGMVYPALSYLEDAGYASVEAAGAKKQYTISVAGLAYLDERRATVEALWTQLARFGERMVRAREDARFADEASQLHAAFDELRDALRAQRGAAPVHLAKLAEIVRRAAAAIRKEPKE